MMNPGTLKFKPKHITDPNGEQHFKYCMKQGMNALQIQIVFADAVATVCNENHLAKKRSFARGIRDPEQIIQ